MQEQILNKQTNKKKPQMQLSGRPPWQTTHTYPSLPQGGSTAKGEALNLCQLRLSSLTRLWPREHELLFFIRSKTKAVFQHPSFACVSHSWISLVSGDAGVRGG